MSNKVDERIVQMRFDNKQFESGVQTSVKSLDALKKGLNLESSAKSLSNLDKVGKSFSLQGIATGVDTIASKFNALGVIGITALANITNSAINAGKNLVSALTVDPVMTGLNEYETKMNAITTILTNTQNKGTTLDEVNAALNDLNLYADKTIYNFAEMTRNIGTFTAAGVDLKTSVTAIKGIANLAAGSGSSALQASTAMYQLSQAIASGSVKLQDWNSVVNAGMGGQLFQNALEKTANELGRGRDMSVSFRESLEKGWITTEVLTKTLEKFANDESLIKAATQVKTFTQLIDTMKESVQSGWAQTWELIIGDREEAAKVFTAVNDEFNAMAGASADARNEMFKFWKENGGRDAIIEAITNSFKALQSILKPIGQAFREVFPAMTGEKLTEISKGIRDITSNFKIGEGTMSNIKETFKGLFSILGIGVKILGFVSSVFGKLIQIIIPGTGSFLSLTASVGSFITKINEAVLSSGIFEKALTGVGKGLDILKEIVNKILDNIGPTLTKARDGFFALIYVIGQGIQNIKLFIDSFKKTNNVMLLASNGTEKAKTSFEKFKEVLIAIKDIVVKVVTSIKNVLTPIFESIKKKFDELSFQDIGAILTGGGFLMLAKTLAKGLSSVDDILSNFSAILGQVGDTLKAFQLKVKAQALLTIAIALGILAAAIVALSFVKMEDLVKSLGALTVVFVELIGGLIFINKYAKDIKKMTGQMIALGIGILLLAKSVKILSEIDTGALVRGTAALGALMGIIAVFIKTTDGGDLKASAGGLIGFSVGIIILSGALAILGKIEPGKLIQGTIALSTLIAVIATFINLTKTGDLKASAGGLIGFSVGITILAGALAILGNLDEGKLRQGVISITMLMTVIAAFINLTKTGDLASSAGGLVGFAIGITILSGALAILGNMNIKSLLQGGVAISSMMLVIATFINLTKTGDLKASAGGLIGFSVGITILAKALSSLAKLEANKLIQGGMAISTIMTSIALFVKLTKGGDLTSTSAGLIAFSVGLTILSAAVSILAGIDSKKITQGVTAVVALMVAIGAFVNLTKEGDLKKSAAGLIAFSTGLMILAGVIAILSALNPQKLMMSSVALAALIASIGLFVNLTKEGDLKKSAAGLIAFSIGIGILAASLVAVGQLDANKIIASGGAITILLLGIIAFVKLTKGSSIIAASAGLIVFSGALMVMSQAIIMLGSVDIATLAKGILGLAGILVIIGLTSFVLAPLTPVILALSSAIVLFGVGCLAIGAGMLLFANGLSALSESGVAGSEALVIAITNIISLFPLALTTLAKGIIEFAKTIGDGAPVIAEAFMKVFTAILDTVVVMMPKLVDAGMKLILGILRGIANNIQQIIEAGADVIMKFMIGVGTKIPQVIDTAFKVIISFINGLADAIRDNRQAIYDAVGNLMTAIIESITGFIPSMINTGANIIKGLIKGMKSSDGEVKSAGTSIVSNMVGGIRNFLDINSPSRVLYDIGKFTIMGLVNALLDLGYKATNAAVNVGSNAVDGIKDAMSNISNVINDNLNTNPTIRPVMDLDSVVAGINSMNSMMNNQNGITVNSAMNRTASINRNMYPDVIKTKITPSEPAVVDPSVQKPTTINLMLQNGKAIAEFIIDDLDNLTGSKNIITGRMIGV